MKKRLPALLLACLLYTSVDFGGQVLRQVLDKVPQLDPKDISDIIIGCSKCEEVQGYNIGRLICLRAGVPYDVPAQTVNRFCSSGLQTIYTAINMIRCGDAEVMVAGGVETMSLLPMGTKDEVRCRWIKENEPGAYMPMGITAENVAEACHITREEDVYKRQPMEQRPIHVAFALILTFLTKPASKKLDPEKLYIDQIVGIILSVVFAV